MTRTPLYKIKQLILIITAKLDLPIRQGKSSLACLLFQHRQNGEHQKKHQYHSRISHVYLLKLNGYLGEIGDIYIIYELTHDLVNGCIINFR